MLFQKIFTVLGLLFTTIFKEVTSSERRVTLNKCCNKYEFLGYDGRKCIAAPNTSTGAIESWFPTEMINMKTLEINVQYNVHFKCRIHESRIASWHPYDKQAEFKLNHDLNLLEYYYKSPGNELRGIFKPSAYCMDKDNTTGRYVARFCPCKHLQCYRKCCLIGFYYSAAENLCLPLPKNMDNFGFSKIAEDKRPATHYYVIHRFPDCIKLGYRTLNSEIRKYDFKFQGNESDMVYDNEITPRFLQRNKYCLDYIRNQRNSSLELNLMTCMKISVKARESRNNSSVPTENVFMLFIGLYCCIYYITTIIVMH